MTDTEREALLAVNNIDDAIAVLNRFKHRGCSEWYNREECAMPGVGDRLESLEAFEAIAVAEKYVGQRLVGDVAAMRDRCADYLDKCSALSRQGVIEVAAAIRSLPLSHAAGATGEPG